MPYRTAATVHLETTLKKAPKAARDATPEPACRIWPRQSTCRVRDSDPAYSGSSCATTLARFTRQSGLGPSGRADARSRRHRGLVDVASRSRTFRGSSPCAPVWKSTSLSRELAGTTSSKRVRMIRGGALEFQPTSVGGVLHVVLEEVAALNMSLAPHLRDPKWRCDRFPRRPQPAPRHRRRLPGRPGG
jgi:hypothetical protein